MSKPSPEQLASAANFSGSQKDYIRAVIQTVITAELQKLRTELVGLIGDANTPTSADNALEALANKVKGLEQRYDEDDKYMLTPAKLTMLIQKMGIE